MLEYMKLIAREGKEFSVEERNLLSVAYKNVIGSKRAAWRILCSISQKEEAKGETRWVEIRRRTIGRVEEELRRVCVEAEEVVGFILENETNFEAQTFFWKM